MVLGFFRVPREESEFAFDTSEGFFAAKLSFPNFKNVISQIQNVTDAQVDGEIGAVFREEEDHQLFVGLSRVDDFKFHDEVFFDIFSVRRSGVNDDSDGGVLFACG